MAGQQTDRRRGLSDEVRAPVSAMWALGDYNRFATELDSQLGRDLVGDPRREAGADVVAWDITVRDMRDPAFAYRLSLLNEARSEPSASATTQKGNAAR